MIVNPYHDVELELGDFVMAEDIDHNKKLCRVTGKHLASVIMQEVRYTLDYGDDIIYTREDLTLVEPNYAVGSYVRFKGEVYKVKDHGINRAKEEFVYWLENKNTVFDIVVDNCEITDTSLEVGTLVKTNEYYNGVPFAGKITESDYLGKNVIVKDKHDSFIGCNSYKVDIVEVYNVMRTNCDGGVKKENSDAFLDKDLAYTQACVLARNYAIQLSEDEDIKKVTMRKDKSDSVATVESTDLLGRQDVVRWRVCKRMR